MTFRKHHHCQFLFPARHSTSACPALSICLLQPSLAYLFFHHFVLTDTQDLFKEKKKLSQLRCTWTSEGGLQGSASGLSPSCSQCLFTFSLRSSNSLLFPQLPNFQQPAPLSAAFSAHLPHLSLSQTAACFLFIPPGNSSLFACSSFIIGAFCLLLPCPTGKTAERCHLFLFCGLCCSACSHLLADI